MTATLLRFSAVVARPHGQADIPNDAIATFMAEGMAGDFDHLLQTAMLSFNCV